MLVWDTAGKGSIYVAAAMGVMSSVGLYAVATEPTTLLLRVLFSQLDKRLCVHNVAHAGAIGVDLEQVVHVRHTMETWKSQCDAAGAAVSPNFDMAVRDINTAIRLPPMKRRMKGRPRLPGRIKHPSEKGAARAKRKRQKR